jgi:hypothetical protein
VSAETYKTTMKSLTLTIKPAVARSRKIRIEVDADKFERLAADFGLFNPDFLKSLDQAENDIRAGRIKKIAALRDLKRKNFHA